MATGSRIGLLAALISLSLSIATPGYSEIDPKPGYECKIRGERITVGALTYHCRKATKREYEIFQYRLIWSKGALGLEPIKNTSFNGRKFGNGAVVGKDIKAGRYWTIQCPGWKHYKKNTLISAALRGSQQSLVELRIGETLLSGCTWYLDDPPTTEILPTGKLSMKTQLLPGRYRPLNEFCMSGPTDPRSPDAISEEIESKNILVWEQLPSNYELVITGSEPWLAYGLTSECGGLIRLR